LSGSFDDQTYGLAYQCAHLGVNTVRIEANGIKIEFCMTFLKTLSNTIRNHRNQQPQFLSKHLKNSINESGPRSYEGFLWLWFLWFL